MRRFAAAVGFAAIFLLGLSGTGMGGSFPNAGCPVGFELAPVTVLGPNFSGQVTDVNNDEMICIKTLKGSGFPGDFIFIDNTTP
jgi:hypothetical protein